MPFTTSARRFPTGPLAYLALGLLATAAYFVVPLSPLSLHLLYDAVGLSAVAAIVVGVRRHRPSASLPWYLFALGQLMMVGGDAARTFYESVLGVEAPFPSVADGLYLAAYPVLATAIFLLIRNRNRSRDRASIIDALIIATSVGAVSWVFVMHPYVIDESLTWPQRIISMAYPLWDLILVAAAARLALGGGVRVPAYYLLLGSLLALMTSDSALLVTQLNGTYESGSLVDLGFLLSYVLWGTAALVPSMRRLAEPVEQPEVGVSRRRVLMLAAAWMITPVLRVVQRLRGDTSDVEVYVTVLATVVLFILVMARLSDLVSVLSNSLKRQREAEARRRESEARFRSLVQSSFDVVTVTDADGVITYQSPAVERVLGYGTDDLVGRRLLDLLHEDDVAAMQRIYERAVAGEHPDSEVRVEFRWPHSEGQWVHMEATVGNSLDDPSVQGLVLNVRDVSERKTLERQLTHQAFHDPLTELPNRALFCDRVEHALARRDGPLSVLFLDIDDFKKINDSLGHSAGDELLSMLAERIRGCLRLGDTAARLGGDEFSILLEQTEDATLVAQRITAAVRRPFLIDGKKLTVSISIGICKSRLADDGADELLRNADAAMYAAKGRGKGRHAVFTQSMHTSAVRRLDLESELRTAIEREEFRVHYQPIFDLETGAIASVEALVRWAHPERGLLAPGEFISLAEETGLIVPIGRWVLETACHQAQAWQELPGCSTLRVNVNLSAAQLEGAALVDEITEMLERTGISPGTLTLEITESMLMRDTESAMRRLTELRALGIRIAIDDFGTGFSSLSYLQRYPCDSLKIAKEFIDDLGRNSEATALVRGIVELSRSLSLETVAEGVEHERQQDLLRDMGCSFVQGYFCGRPQGSERIRALLDQAAAIPAAAT